MNTIVLHGALKRQFGGPFTLDVKTPRDAIRALCTLKPGFMEAIRKGTWRVIRGRRGEGGRALTEEELALNLPGQMHIVAAPAGSGGGNNGAVKVIVGVVLIAAAFYFAPAVAGAMGPTQGLGAAAFSVAGANFTYANIAMFGAAMALGGVSMMLSPMPKANDSTAQDTKPSFMFSGSLNSPEQGPPVPVVLGEIRTGGIPISTGVDVEEMPT